MESIKIFLGLYRDVIKYKWHLWPEFHGIGTKCKEARELIFIGIYFLNGLTQLYWTIATVKDYKIIIKYYKIPASFIRGFTHLCEMKIIFLQASVIFSNP